VLRALSLARRQDGAAFRAPPLEDPARSEERAEELAAYIKDRPGKIFKLLSALHFLGVALACRARRSKPVRDFWEKPPAGTFGDMILAWCYMTSLLCLLVLSPGSPSSRPMQAGWHLSSSSAGAGGTSRSAMR
jgi:hypothetical protein